ncbi:MAG: twin-arginine translocase subunit TatC [Anaerolineae bacterium]|nr:twin-arginine translocase subunit TatC [Anaerolineae bacterium]
MKKPKTKKPARNNKGEMSLLEHLDELRKRLTVAVIALLIGTLASLAVTKPVLEILVAPIKTSGAKIIYTGPTEAPSVYFTVALALGVVLAMPVILYQVFMYLRPGLTSNERRYIVIGIPFASLSFVAGVAFAIFVAIPNAASFLTGFLNDIGDHTYSARQYLSFISSVMLWLGLIFETPLVMFILARVGIVSPQGFAKARRFVIIGAAVAAAVITPTPDVINMLIIMGPFILLYEIGILLARVAQIGRERAAQAS